MAILETTFLIDLMKNMKHFQRVPSLRVEGY